MDYSYERTADRAAGRGGIYIASKTRHAHRWRLLRNKIGYPICSTWIDEAEPGQSDDLSDLWLRCIHEASSADLLIICREPDDAPLKGAWIELGAALSNGVPVFAVGLEEFTVAHHPGIRHFTRMKDAIGAVPRELRP